MRISDLSRHTGVPVATIKFYLRERLLPPGTPTGRNQATYSDMHLRQLLLIRAFTNIADLDLSTVRELLDAIDNPALSLPDLYDVTDRALFADCSASRDPDGVQQARGDVDQLVGLMGWTVGDDAPGRDRLAVVLAALRRLGCDNKITFFVPFANAAEGLAEQELDLLPSECADDDRAAAVIRSVLFGVVLATIRRLAQEHVVAQRFGAAQSAAAQPS
ncbi:MerR family transcriptional regulator [Solwaraspora sp. WMMD406]|uniref:MerR family transcriptional regulator n=1 Tax=Solwaraspora sp. WMMD406 TaxID=3016095 RepID=UPI00241655AE|nr:MerR family transcriptional regulator [Solwaraspora sp. WMMD406]MDG4766936.1 MerR family transcriptional regulator [Solwaraspora sp. WMMD406]